MASTSMKVVKKNGYSNVFARRKQRRKEAGVRQDNYDSLSLTEKIDLAKGRRGESKKELARLNAKLQGLIEKMVPEPVVGGTPKKVKKAKSTTTQ